MVWCWPLVCWWLGAAGFLLSIKSLALEESRSGEKTGPARSGGGQQGRKTRVDGPPNEGDGQGRGPLDGRRGW